MRRLFPSPALSCGLFAIWLALSPSVDAATVLLGAILAWLAPLITRSLRPMRVQMRRPTTALRLLMRVVVDTLRSNAGVLAVIISGRRASPSGFVRIPLELRDPNGLAVLAMIITATPGTAWAELAPDGSALLIHVFALEDEKDLVASVKRRYERPLMEIFE